MVTASGLLRSLRQRDPKGVALRRAVRTAIVLPIALVLLTNISWIGSAGLTGIFGVLGLLVFCDFAGSLKHRARSYLMVVAAGIPLTIIGSYAAQTIAASVVVMAIVAGLMGMLAIVRGDVAASQKTLLLVTVLALTGGRPQTALQSTIGWIIGGLIATFAAVFLWPARPGGEMRRCLGCVFDAAADAIGARWCHFPSDLSAAGQALGRLDENLTELAAHNDGNLQRPTNVAAEARSYGELRDEAGRLRMYQRWVDVTPADAGPPDADLRAVNHSLAQAVVDSLRSTAERVRSEITAPADEEALRSARVRHRDGVSAWISARRGVTDPIELRERIDDTFPLRLSSFSAALLTDSSAHAADGKHRDSMVNVEVFEQRHSRWGRFSTQVSWDSPWVRNSLRSAVALAASVGLAKYLGLEHSFWIVLGTLSALRFDALGTGRTVVQALVGTTAGALIGCGLIIAFGDNATVWWVLLPIVIFVTSYTPGTLSFATSQAGFTLSVLVLFALLFPPKMDVAELRVLEVAIGVGLSLAVSLLMWPRGIAASLYSRTSEAIEAAGDHLVAAVDFLCRGAIDDRLLADYRQRSFAALERARESYDLSLAQKPPKTIPLRAWALVVNTARAIDFAATIVPGPVDLDRMVGSAPVVPANVVGPLLAAANDVRSRVRSEIQKWRREESCSTDPTSGLLGAPSPSEITQSPQVDALRASISLYLSQPEDWAGSGPDPRPVLLIWISDWLALMDWAARRLRSVLPAAEAQSVPAAAR